MVRAIHRAAGDIHEVARRIHGGTGIEAAPPWAHFFSIATKRVFPCLRIWSSRG